MFCRHTHPGEENAHEPARCGVQCIRNDITFKGTYVKVSPREFSSEFVQSKVSVVRKEANI